MFKRLLIVAFLLLFAVTANAGPVVSGGATDNPSSTGSMITGRAVTAFLHVTPNGDGSNGSSWAAAYTTIQSALDAASTDADGLTLILISPHTTYYDINTTGDPTWTGNYILKGSHRNWARIKNDHPSATSIMKFTGRVSLIDLNINLGTKTNGIIMTAGGTRGCCLQFVGEDLTSAKTALEIVGDTNLKNAKFTDVHMKGHKSYMTGLKLDKCSYGLFERFRVHECLVGCLITNAVSDHNLFNFWDVGDCDGGSGIGFDINSGNEQVLENVTFHHNDKNIDDEVGDHIYTNIRGSFNMDTEPQNLVGVTLVANNVADTWGEEKILRLESEATSPFRIVGYSFTDLSTTQKYKIRFSADSGATYFDEVFLQTTKQLGSSAPSGTEYIFNTNTRIVGSTKAESGGEDTIGVLLKIQEM